jgi:hypothetical protein
VAARPVGRHRSTPGNRWELPGGRSIPRWASVAGLVAGFLLIAVAQAPAVEQGRALASIEKKVLRTTANFTPVRAVAPLRTEAARKPPVVNRRPLLAQATRSAQRDPRGAARVMAAQMYGWTSTQWSCLDKLWTRESRWNYRAQNSSSGAYGIPQALPGWKMAMSGSDWRTNPVTQIRWGLGYIRSRYNSPCSAWGHSESHGWY